MPPGPVARRHADPLSGREGVALSPERMLTDALEDLHRTHPWEGIPADADIAFDHGVSSRSSTGSMPSASASSSRSVSIAKAAVGAPGARYAPNVNRFVCTP